MSIRLFALPTRPRGRRGRAAVIAALGALMLLAPSTADALQVTVDMPDSVTVGQTGLTARVVLRNTSQAAARVCNPGECTAPAGGIIFVPSCAAIGAPPACSVPDLGVFSVAPTATIPLGSACGTGGLVTSFSVQVADAAQGSLRLVPNAAISLGPVNTAAAVCDISLTFGVTKLPAADAAPISGVQTRQLAWAQVRLAVAGAPLDEAGAGEDLTTVVPPTTQPPPAPPPIVVPPPPIVVPPPPVIQPGDLDHFKCYEVRQRNLRQRRVRTRDQFGERRTRVLRTRQLCNPVSKNDAKVLHPRAHLTCYQTRDTGNPTPPRTVLVTNQFGQRRLETTRPSRLCVPSLKRRNPGPMPTSPNPTRLLDHFRCYDVKAQPATRTVKLADQFKTSRARVIRVIRLCNPVRKNDEPRRRPKSHLVCYSITEQQFNSLGVRVRNQFGIGVLRVRRPETLCLPSFKEVVQTAAAASAPSGLDHFKCYDSEQPQLPPRFVGLRDQFGQSEGQVVATRLLCNPVRKNNGRVINPRAHLVCYETPSVGTVPFQPRDVRVFNQFGVRQLSVLKPVQLCVPSLKRKGAGAAPTGPNPTLVLDHFRCYDVKPHTTAKRVKLVDQFKTSKTKVLRLVRLCNPVRKNNEVVRRPRAHLVCYSIEEVPFQALAVTVRNQFGVAGLRARKPALLCLPSFKKLVTAAGAEITPANPG